MLERYAPAALVVAVGGAYLPWLFHADALRWGVLYLACALILLTGFRWSDVPSYAVPFLAWAGLSLAWSSDPLRGVWQALNLSALLVVLPCSRRWSASTKSSSPFAEPILITCGIALAWAVFAPATFASFGNENFAAEYLLIALPLILSWRHWIAWATAGAILVYLLGFNASKLEWVALGAVFLFLRWWWLAGTAALSAVALALVSLDWSDSLFYRWEIWKVYGRAILDAPLFGHGLGSSALVFERYVDSPGLTDVLPWVAYGQPHNELLNLLTETGLVGLLLALWALIALYRHAKDNQPAWMSLAIGGGLSMVSFPLHHPAPALLCVVACAILLRPSSPASSSSRPAPCFGATGCLRSATP